MLLGQIMNGLKEKQVIVNGKMQLFLGFFWLPDALSSQMYFLNTLQLLLS